ncbi:MAG: T9SS type A sorting domain-containing protein [Bacteroidota bacterium]|nr:T9SS type A sorting domain-containing protein [Bacteroidota bacterium]
MKMRLVIPGMAFILFAFPAFLRSQSMDRTFAPMGIPKIECTLRVSADKLFFRGNDYSPNTITVTVVVRNISAGNDTARNIVACMVQDKRFNIIDRPCSDTIPFVVQGDSVELPFTLQVASERKSDGYDTIRAVATAMNGANDDGEYTVWVEHEYYPIFRTTCSKLFGQIVFDDARNEYNPNPFQIQVDVMNINDGASDSTIIQYLGTRGVSVDTTDPVQNTPIRLVGTIPLSGKTTVVYDLRAIKRNNDTTVTLCFQIQGKGGYKRKTYVDSCCIDVFIPQAKQAVYDIACDILPDSISFINHRYTPDPFVYTATVRNTGTAIGKNVKAQIMLPPSLQIDAGDSVVVNVGDLATGGSYTMSWRLRPATRYQRDTVKVCVRVYDLFENSATCCDSVIIDSVRSAKLLVECIVPDSVRLDAARGIYDPDSFFVYLRVSNVGSDYADSVKATIIIQSPDVIGKEPFFPIKRKLDYSIPPSDTLEVGNTFVFDWLLQALPRAVSGFITVKFKAEALNAPTEETECRIYIPKLDAPQIERRCYTTPIDSLHFNPATGGYDPPEILFTVEVWNPGGGVAKNLNAVLALPPRVLLPPGESLEKRPMTRGATPSPDIGPQDTAYATWRILPIERRDFGADLEFTVTVTSENVAGRYTCSDGVFVPALPYTVALAIPQNPVTYYGQHIDVPIYIDNPEGKSIKSFDFRIEFNVDIDRNPLTEPLVRLDPTAPYVDGPSTLLGNTPEDIRWDVKVEEFSPTKLHVTVVSRGPMLSLDPSNPNKPLMGIGFYAVFGLEPFQNESRYSELLWPDPSVLLDSVLINNGTIYPRVTDGRITIAGDCLRPLNASDRYIVSQNRPNPFNPSTVIEYAVPVESEVRLTVYDALGRIVKVLVDEVKAAGTHAVRFDAGHLPSGVYLYKMDAPGYSKTMKMILAR